MAVQASKPVAAQAGPVEIRGKVARTYRVATIGVVDENLLGLNRWLTEQIVKAPEFGISYVRRWRHDVDALLDARLRLMS